MKKKATSFDLQAGVSAQGGRVASFVYSPAPGWTPAAPAIPAGNGKGAGPAGGERASEEAAAENAAALQHKLQEARERGAREGEAQARKEHQAAIEELRNSVGAALLKFEQERSGYFRRVEREVVELSLAIVRKMLRREAQMDPLLLTGLVRVALEKVAASHTLRLRAHPEQIPAWREYFAQARDLPKIPELLGDASLRYNQVQLESEMGVSDLSLESQLKEIEQGLFDLLAQKPAAG